MFGAWVGVFCYTFGRGWWRLGWPSIATLNAPGQLALVSRTRGAGAIAGNARTLSMAVLESPPDSGLGWVPLPRFFWRPQVGSLILGG
jgi:hypothetical protein